jgi:hypothetical protein
LSHLCEGTIWDLHHYHVVCCFGSWESFSKRWESEITSIIPFPSGIGSFICQITLPWLNQKPNGRQISRKCLPSKHFALWWRFLTVFKWVTLVNNITFSSSNRFHDLLTECRLSWELTVWVIVP